MCYPPPGPRCSSHANAEWLKACAALEEETDTNNRIRLQMRVDDAYRNFCSTPRGQNRLRREIAAIANDPEQKELQIELSLQLRDGELTRKNQMTAFLAMKNNKEFSIKSLLKTTNKQEQAVGIVFHTLMQVLPEAHADTCHILPENIIQCGDAKILCLPEKHQRVAGTFTEDINGYLSSPDIPSESLDILASFNDPSLMSDAHLSDITETLLIAELKKQNINYVAIVDVKTEAVITDSIDNLLSHYKPTYKQRKKLGGTSPYAHGLSQTLKDEIVDSPLEQGSVTQTIINGVTRTFITDVSPLLRSEQHTRSFYFAEKSTPDGTLYYEVRSRHQSSKYDLLVSLRRKMLVLPNKGTYAVRRFVFEDLKLTEQHSSAA